MTRHYFALGILWFVIVLFCAIVFGGSRASEWADPVPPLYYRVGKSVGTALFTCWIVLAFLTLFLGPTPDEHWWIW